MIKIDLCDNGVVIDCGLFDRLVFREEDAEKALGLIYRKCFKSDPKAVVMVVKGE